MMDAKTYLRQLHDLDREIDALLQRRERYEALATRRTASYSDMPRGGRTESSVEYFACRLVELAQDIDAKIDAFVDLTREAEHLIEQVQDERYRRILKYRYLNGWRWERIAEAMNYDRRQVTRLHGDALQAFGGVRETCPTMSHSSVI